MKTIVLFSLLLLPFSLAAQTEKPAPADTSAGKGATPHATQNSTPKTQNSTRAVVVGISDYRDPAIPDLQYAHRDAEAFAEWLRSPAGGSVPDLLCWDAPPFAYVSGGSLNARKSQIEWIDEVQPGQVFEVPFVAGDQRKSV